MRPWLGPLNVTSNLFEPLILVKIKNCDFWGNAVYDHEASKLEAISVHGKKGWRQPVICLGDDDHPVIYIAVPAIEGKTNVEFIAANTEADEAYMVGSAAASVKRQPQGKVIKATEDFIASDRPEFIEVLSAYLREIAKAVLQRGYPLLFTDIPGRLEKRNPALFKQLLQKSSIPGIQICGFSKVREEGDFYCEKSTGTRGAILFLLEFKDVRPGEYFIRGTWHESLNKWQNVSKTIVLVNGTAEVN